MAHERVRIMVVTPKMAAKMIARHEALPAKKRPQRISRLIAKYAAYMRKKQWVLTANGIMVTRAGAVVDGLNRLKACVVADQSFRTVFLWVDTLEAVPFTDIGKTREPTAWAEIIGVARYRALFAAAVRLIYWYERNKLGEALVARSDHGLPPQYMHQMTDTEQRRIEGLTDVAVTVDRMTSGAVVTLLLHVAQQAQVDATPFIEGLRTGENLSATSPVLHLREYLLRDRQRPHAERREPIQTYAAVVRAWNLWRTGKPVTSGTALGWSRDKSAFPVPV